MSHFGLVIIISFFWLASEIILAVLKRSRGGKTNGKDKFTLQFLWIVIVLSITAGVYLGIKGIGMVSALWRIAPIIGVIMIIMGLAIRWTAILTLRRLFTVNVDIVTNHRIITGGIYKYVRHPSYSGSLLSFLGLGIYFSNWLSAIVIFVPILAVFLIRISVEEKALLTQFKEEYLDYCGRTRRLIPFIY